jgi:hypothetical protein
VGRQINKIIFLSIYWHFIQVWVICISCKFITFSLLVVWLLPLVSTFNPFHSLYFPLRGHGWRGKGRNSDVIHHCNRRYRLAKRQTCRSFQRTLFMQKAHTHVKLKYIPGQETTLWYSTLKKWKCSTVCMHNEGSFLNSLFLKLLNCDTTHYEQV